jgi:hypothetical protein
MKNNKILKIRVNIVVVFHKLFDIVCTVHWGKKEPRKWWRKRGYIQKFAFPQLYNASMHDPQMFFPANFHLIN